MRRFFKRCYNNRKILLTPVLAVFGTFLVISAEGHHCPPGYVTVLGNSSANDTCLHCSDLCPPGQGWSVKCDSTITSDVIVECVHCDPGISFSSNYGHEQCQLCQSTFCLDGEIIDGTCTTKKDSSSCSGKCNDGYAMDANRTSCQPQGLSVQSNSTTRKLTPTKTTTSSSVPSRGHSISNSGPSSLPYRPHSTRHMLNIQKSMSSILPTSSIQQNAKGAYGIIGHPALFISLLFLLFILVALLIYFSRKRTQECFKSVLACGNQDAESQTVESQSLMNDFAMQHVALPYSSQDAQCQTDKCEANENQLNENHFRSQDLVYQGPEPVSSLGTPAGSSPSDSQQNFYLENEIQGSHTTAKNTALVSHEPPSEKTESAERVRQGPVQSDEDEDEVDPETNTETAQASSIDGLLAKYYFEICDKMNDEVHDKDWKRMAAKMGYKIQQVKRFGKNPNPTDAVLQHWKTEVGNNLHKLRKIFTDIRRDDVVEIIDKALDICSCDGL